MRAIRFFWLILILFLAGLGNPTLKAQEYERQITRNQVEAHLRFLASDELQGRKTGEQGNWVAARYIAEQFRAFGVHPVAQDGAGYYQVIPFAEVTPPGRGVLTIGNQTLTIDDDLLIRMAPGGVVQGKLTYLPYATPGEVTEKVKGKMVIGMLGSEDVTDPQAAFSLSAQKKAKLQAMGALGLIEIYRGRHPWHLIRRYFGSSSSMVILEPGESPEFTGLVINAPEAGWLEQLKGGEELAFNLDTDGTRVIDKPSPNVAGIITGTDPTLRNEYVILSAHFDHVGIASSKERPDNQTDSIYNGARDNAMGVTALLTAAKTLAAHPPKRSVLLLALTAEEIGLIGSKYYVNHPLVPLEQTVFNLNTDGAGNSDSSIVAIMGFHRVGAAHEIETACRAFGLDPFADPAPEQNLFDRSDNVSFAAVGIPAPTFSPGFRKFDDDILKHYHRPSDEVETMDLNYVHRFCQAYALAARLVADKGQRPRWVEDDKYYPAFRELYGESRD